MSGVNPQGCQVQSFKAPSREDLDHDFLWRTTKNLPERGRIGIFNRSYYEETLVVRVHPGLLAAQQIPPEFVTKRVWQERFEDIGDFERYLARNGIAICKFFLHVSKREQKKRFLERLDDPDKNWKFCVDPPATALGLALEGHGRNEASLRRARLRKGGGPVDATGGWLVWAGRRASVRPSESTRRRAASSPTPATMRSGDHR